MTRLPRKAVRGRAAPAPGRAGRAAAVGDGNRAAARRGLRGPGRRGQGRHDQARHRVPQPPRRPDRRAARPDRARADPVVLPALRRRTCPPRARSSCSTGPGTTGPASSGSWASARPTEYRRFLRQCPVFERMLVEDGILLRKYWFSVSDEEQERRFRVAARRTRCAAWKFSRDGPASRSRGGWSSRGPRTRCSCTRTSTRPRGGSSRPTTSARARINMIAHLLSSVPYEHVRGRALKLPPRPPAAGLRAAAAGAVPPGPRPRGDAERVRRLDPNRAPAEHRLVTHRSTGPAPVALRPALALTDRLRTSARLGALIGVLLVPPCTPPGRSSPSSAGRSRSRRRSGPAWRCSGPR